MIETTHRSDAQRIYHRGFGQDEVAFQLSGRRATLTDQGEYMLETGDFLLIPPGTSHRNVATWQRYGSSFTAEIHFTWPRNMSIAQNWPG